MGSDAGHHHHIVADTMSMVWEAHAYLTTKWYLPIMPTAYHSRGAGETPYIPYSISSTLNTVGVNVPTA